MKLERGHIGAQIGWRPLKSESKNARLKASSCSIDNMKSGLSDDLLRAIGSVSAQWAVLEYQMSRATVAGLTAFGNTGSKQLNSLSFLARRVAFEDALSWSNVPSSVQGEGYDLVDRIEKIENDRHKIIHGMAEEIDPIHPEVLFSRTTEVLWFSQRFTVAEIERIADRIGDLNLDIFAFAVKLWCSRPIAE
jgi:hypothetical protein